MTPKLQRRFDSLERSKAAMLEDLSTWTPSQLAFRPATGAWSATDILDHIARTEGGILQAMRDNLATPKPLKKKDRLTSFVVRCIMRSPLKGKVPTEVTAILPSEIATSAQAIAAWEKARARLCQLVTAATPAQIEGGVFSPPRGGWMSLADTLLFLRLHHEHHLGQLSRLKKTLPASPTPTSSLRAPRNKKRLPVPNSNT